MLKNNKMDELDINYSTLINISNIDKESEVLGELPEGFIEKVTTYFSEKKKLLERKNSDTEIFSQSEKDINKRNTELENIERIIKTIYNQREQKIIDLARRDAKLDSKSIFIPSFSPKEKEFYDGLVERLSKHRRLILKGGDNGSVVREL